MNSRRRDEPARAGTRSLAGPLALPLATLLVACASAPPGAALDGATADPPRQPGALPDRFYADPPVAGRVFRLDPAASQLSVLVFRSGALAAHGHDHALAAGGLQGAVFLPTDGLEHARVDLRLPVQALEVDPPALRERLGAAFTASVPDGARDGTRGNLLGPRLLDAARFPFVVVSGSVATGALPRLLLDIDVVVRGEHRRLRQPLAVDVAIDGAVLRARGAFAVHHAELGLTPFSAFAGLLQVADPLLIEFDLVAREGAGPGSPAAPDLALYTFPPSDHHARFDHGRPSGDAMEQR